ncbi:endonuclease domain-containing protein [Solemya velesiana gill symbiont]|uniref:DNA (Cytosine-5-)-methyltransferase n=1 Tax=Solemya velesiana gill symbiont TaxID=1918948 RepID=A0A1T2KT21_9GAMM|nr:endonuclease domain-containing protein [Solemya velesiana gill symbiont]OOZ35999.1 DNA (cytosine-5-)-methyltransferase [Solemya velesiana gill symbiont]
MDLTNRARELRRNQTDAEQLLWRSLKSRQLNGCKFRRQFPIHPYIVDFVCLSENLVVDLDGGQHTEQLEYDEKRTAFLESNGYRVVRFWNNEVLKELPAVLEEIARQLDKNSTR